MTAPPGWIAVTGKYENKILHVRLSSIVAYGPTASFVEQTKDVTYTWLRVSDGHTYTILEPPEALALAIGLEEGRVKPSWQSVYTAGDR